MPISPERQNPFWPAPPKPHRKTAWRWIAAALLCVAIVAFLSQFL